MIVNKDKARFLQIMNQLVGADEIDLMEGLAELSNLFPKLRDLDPDNVLGRTCRQVSTLLERNVIGDSLTFSAPRFQFLKGVPPDFRQEMLCQAFRDAVSDLAELELSSRQKLEKTTERLKNQLGAFRKERERIRLMPWEWGMQIMIERWLVVCNRCRRYGPTLPRPEVRLRDPSLYKYDGRDEFAMYVELEDEGKVDDDFPVLYRVDVCLEDSTLGGLSDKQRVYELPRLDDIIVYTKVEPTPGELRPGKSESGRLREELKDPAHRALTVVLKKVTSKDFMAQARSVCGEMQIPATSPRLLIQDSLSPVAKSVSPEARALSVETRLMTCTGPLTPEKAWLSLRVEDVKDE
jgi:hypothetical protein